MTASSTSADMIRGVETSTSTPQASLNSHSFLGWLTRADGAGHAELGLGQQRGDEVGLVVAGRGDDDVALVEAGPPPARRSRRSRRAATRRPGTRSGLIAARVLVDEQHLVAVVEQLAGDRAADRCRLRRWRRASVASSGPVGRSTGVDAASAFSLAHDQVEQVALLDHACPASGSMPSPSRSDTGDPGAGRRLELVDRASPDPRRRCSGTWSTTDRAGRVAEARARRPAGSSRRSIWSAVQCTVATVGMPSRW